MKQLALGVGGVNVQAPVGIPTGGMTVGWTIIHVVVDLLLITAVLLSLGYIIFGGFKWMSSGGDKQAVQTARMTLTYAIIGLVLTFLSFLIIQTLGVFFNVHLI